MTAFEGRRQISKFLIGITLILAACSSVFGQDSLFERLDAGVEDGSLEGLHSLVSVVEGELFASAYFEGDDEVWGRPQGIVAHGPDTKHDLRSVTKSVVGLLYAIARDEGIVADPDASLIEQFTEYEDLQSDVARRKITIEHALNMTMGTAWNENLPYTDPKNSEIAMENADDRYRFVLEQDIVGEPGAKWNYSGGATALIAKIIANGSGMSIDAYANKKLFEPLGIKNYRWIAGRDGEPSAASGLRMTAPDLAKIGQLVAAEGVYEGQRIVSEEALADMLQPRVTIDNNFHYSHFWYLLGPKEKPVLAAGFGNGGQRISVNAEQDLVTVIFAGNYNQPDAWRLPVKVIEEYLVPELRKAGKI